MIFRHNAYYSNTTSYSDVMYGYKNQEVVIFDLTRATDMDKVNYSTLETFKNGVAFSKKYQSNMRVFPPATSDSPPGPVTRDTGDDTAPSSEGGINCASKFWGSSRASATEAPPSSTRPSWTPCTRYSLSRRSAGRLLPLLSLRPLPEPN